jgi:hypothetical protein
MNFADDPMFEKNRYFCGSGRAPGHLLHPHHNWFVCAAMEEADIQKTLDVSGRCFRLTAQKFLAPSRARSPANGNNENGVTRKGYAVFSRVMCRPAGGRHPPLRPPNAPGETVAYLRHDERKVSVSRPSAAAARIPSDRYALFIE